MKFLSRCDPTNGCGHVYPGDMTHCPKCSTPEHFSDDVSSTLNVRDYVYDIETYPNAFTIRFIHPATGMNWKFEISDRINQIEQLISFVYNLRDQRARMVGYNNVGFDYPVLHFIMMNPWVSVIQIYDRAMAVIKANGPAKFAFMIWDRERIVEQVDLYKIHHFDNMAKATSLKKLEIFMRMKNIEDLPFPVGTILTSEQIDELHRYNNHDVVSTVLFYVRTLSEISFREDLSTQYNCNMINHNDTKIGAEVFIHKLEDSGIPCYEKIAGKRSPRQTIRPSIALNDIILPWIDFEFPEFKRILEWFKAQTITETKGAFKNINCIIDGVKFDFGTGGVHACANNKKYIADNGKVIQLRDVKSYYPNLAIKNRFHPEHLGEGFCDIYEDMYNERVSHKKGTPENAMLKLALNGTYGNSNNVHSPFYDPLFTMKITINGQLLLCLLAEKIMKAPSVEIINVNTDGVGYACDETDVPYIDAVCDWWCNATKLALDTDNVSRFFSRDVNNYVMEHTSGKLKRKGAYEYNVRPHQNSSSLVVQLATEACLVRGEDPSEFIRNHKDAFDFMCTAKAPRSSSLVMRWALGDDVIDLPLANIVRYFVSVNGGSLVKISPPTGKPGTWKRKPRVAESEYQAVINELMDFKVGCERDVDGTPHDERIHTKNKSKHDTREMSIQAGLLVTDCSDADRFDWSAINYDWYIDQVKKLVDCYT